jgi:hypothetical protein
MCVIVVEQKGIEHDTAFLPTAARKSNIAEIGTLAAVWGKS